MMMHSKLLLMKMQHRHFPKDILIIHSINVRPSMLHLPLHNSISCNGILSISYNLKWKLIDKIEKEIMVHLLTFLHKSI